MPCDGAKAMSGLPCLLQRGQRTSLIDHAVATVAGNDQPMVLGNERGFDLRPEPRIALGRQGALKRRTVASASRSSSHWRRMRVTLSRISSLRALVHKNIAVTHNCSKLASPPSGKPNSDKTYQADEGHCPGEFFRTVRREHVAQVLGTVRLRLTNQVRAAIAIKEWFGFHG
jgi:hypothetical protein